ncbi:MAG: class I SAM-dependent methyltransferase, partial [Planctomycetota bacterium]|nr:class I SAM-dependent methyltransferase [Planctomycetota bacterium]
MDQGLTVNIDRVCDEITVINEVLSLDSKTILELGCGRAELTRIIASGGHDRKVIALEVDEIQHRLNLKIDDLPNVRFDLGGAEAILLDDSSVDVVFMFKSLHHVPVDLMDQALSELARVLKPGGYAYISEPIFRGSLNEVIRIFHDESKVRHGAFEAIRRAVESGLLTLKQEIFFQAPRRFQDFSAFEKRV